MKIKQYYKYLLYASATLIAFILLSFIIINILIRQNPDYQYGHVVLAATYGKLGRLDEASRAVQAIKRLNPFFETKGYGSLFRDPADAAKVVDGLQKAGLK